MSVSVCLMCFIIGTVVIIVFDICMSETAVAMVNFQGLNKGRRFKYKWLCAAGSHAVNHFCQSVLLIISIKPHQMQKIQFSAVIKDRSHQYLINSIVISVLISCVAGLFLSGPVGVTVTLHLHYKTIRINYMRKMTNYHLLTFSEILILTLIWCCCCSVFKYVCAFLFSNIYFHIPNT